MPPTRDVYKIIGENLRNERMKAGLSQEQLAEKAGLARNYIGNVERAEKKISLETLARVAKALKIDLKDLVQ